MKPCPTMNTIKLQKWTALSNNTILITGEIRSKLYPGNYLYPLTGNYHLPVFDTERS
jgi:hypothetical protein